MPEQRPPRMFVLRRTDDETGVSGVGDVAHGIEFPSGVVALCWVSAWPTSVVFHDRGIESVEAVHGHGGKTQIVWLAANREGEAWRADAVRLADLLRFHDDRSSAARARRKSVLDLHDQLVRDLGLRHV